MATTTQVPGEAPAQRRRGTAPEQQPGTSPAESIAPPPKMRRRPLVAVAAVAAICLGALVSMWAWQSSSDAQDVLAVRETIERGQTIERDDLMTVKITIDPALRPLLASEVDSVVGQRAALDIAAGGVVTAEQLTDAAIPPKGESVVGISLSSAMLPVNQVRVGDKVRVVATAGEQGEVTTSIPEAIEAIVVRVTVDEMTGNSLVNVSVPHENAPYVATLAASGKAALVLDSQED